MTQVGQKVADDAFNTVPFSLVDTKEMAFVVSSAFSFSILSCLFFSRKGATNRVTSIIYVYNQRDKYTENNTVPFRTFHYLDGEWKMTVGTGLVVGLANGLMILSR